jgi:hypothetical protein
MTIYFAAARTHGHAAVARALSPKVELSHANDNARSLIGNPVMRAALALFAEHGLGAAQLACEKAEAATLDGNDRDCRHWLSVCRMFDRRLADSWALRLEIALIA